MDLKIQIKNWLDGNGSHAIGVELYGKCDGSNKRLQNRLKLKNDWAINQLRAELQRLMPLQVSKKITSVAKKVSNPIKEVSKKKVHKKIQTDKVEPFEIVEIKRLRNAAYRERDYLHSQLEHYKTNDERYEAAKRILELQKEIEAHWARLDSYTATGNLPVIPEEKNLKNKVIDKFQRQKNVRSAISQRKSWIKKERAKANPKLEKIDNWTKQLNTYEAELLALNEFLK